MNILDVGKKGTLLIIDDLMSETDSRVTKIFTKGSHHLNCSEIYISQNLFNKSKENKNICLNTHYLVLFKNPRDSAQVMHLGQQIFPDAIKYFKEPFVDATSFPYSYLLIDLRTTTPDLLRLGTDIFSDKRTIVYVHRLSMNTASLLLFIRRRNVERKNQLKKTFHKIKLLSAPTPRA